MAMLIPHVIFNDLFKRYIHITTGNYREATAILNKLEPVITGCGYSGQLPLLLGYYHTRRKSVLLFSAGISAGITL